MGNPKAYIPSNLGHVQLAGMNPTAFNHISISELYGSGFFMPFLLDEITVESSSKNDQTLVMLVNEFFNFLENIAKQMILISLSLGYCTWLVGFFRLPGAILSFFVTFRNLSVQGA